MTAIAHSQPVPASTSATSPHEHGWSVESRHSTSDGVILYVRCTSCGVRRVDREHGRGTPPTALSTTAPREHPTGAPARRLAGLEHLVEPVTTDRAPVPPSGTPR
ncbi:MULTISPECIES: hypothetical protein [unclassified Microbacterium]|uniref:hypothetical protein n=1 Tax=unclassified Microbacterium TaxID=2609290 RepID=UPI00301AD9F3